MIKEIVAVNLQQKGSSYPITIGHDLLRSCGKWAKKRLGKDTLKAVIVSNHTVFALYGKQTEESLTKNGFAVSHFLIKDGEQHKDFATVESMLNFLAENGLTRTDTVIALGGGVIGDIAGFAASIHLRGINFLQIPTTLLSMVDSSVGGKTGVNSSFGKNLIGSFYQPFGVLIDTRVLATLPRREMTAGLCEIVKHAAIGGKGLLKQTDSFLSQFPVEKFDESYANSNFKSEISNLIAANVVFKAKIVADDDCESAKRLDGKSRKILNFGHTFAHALERVTNYTYFKHGEAVGHGIKFAVELSKSLDLIDNNSVNLLYDVLHRVGPLPSLANIDPKEVFEALRFDKKNLAGSLQFVLLKGIGKPVIVSERDIPRPAIQAVLKRLLH